MLYIIAGLVGILLVAVLVIRKNKAQKQPNQSLTQADKSETKATPISKAKSSNITQSTPKETVTKFDHLTVAQRFMDQQRYDKAIESVERGLVETPNESQLLLKLLNIYAITNQYSDFSKTYKAIRAHGDSSTIDEAEQLKVLVDQEQSPADVAAFEPIDQTSFEGIDFDLPRTQVERDNIQSDELETWNDSGLSQQNDVMNDSDTEDDFDLTLANLETSSLEVDSTDNLENFNINDMSTDEDVGKNGLVSSGTNLENSFSQAQNIDDDFSLDFDSISDSELSSTSILTDDLENRNLSDQNVNQLNVKNDDFVLDFDELTADTSLTDGDSLTEQHPTNEESFDDFVLSLNDENISTNDPVFENTLENNVEDMTLQLDDTGSGQIFDIDTIEILDSETQSVEAPVSTSNSDVASSQMFDDNTPIDDNFDFDSLLEGPTATTPVEEIINLDFQDAAITPAIDTDSQFAADFDFVKTLDNNQVTLDLAAQYLQLGEYDSAKRLLNEVIIHGNNEQQQQAHSLLTRTA